MLADHHVLFGREPEELRVMIENQPHLLCCVTEAVDPASRKIKGTLYQKASARDQHEHARGLHYFDENIPAPRTFKLKLLSETSMYVMNDGRLIIGENSCITAYGDRTSSGTFDDKDVEKLISNRDNRAAKFMRQRENSQKKNCCTIM